MIWKRVGRSLAIGLVAGLVACTDQNGIPAKFPTTADRLANTIGILRTATRDDPKILRVLFYGQSITSPKWTDQLLAHWRRQYPNVHFEAENLAIGGFPAQRLQDTVDRDIDHAQPDLVIFHVYGDHRAYERIVRAIRSRSAAELILSTDHLVAPVEPVCPVGLRTTVALPSGCTGTLWLHQHDWGQRMSSVIIPQLAVKYGAVIEPRRDEWAAYLRANALPISALLADGLHPNDAGWHVMAQLFANWFDRVVAQSPIRKQHLVQRIALADGLQTWQGTVSGSRIELLSRQPLSGDVSATVDGRNAASIDGCWQTSRVTAIPGTTGWPAIRRVTVDRGIHRDRQWVITLGHVGSADQAFPFTLSDETGKSLGSGVTSKDFASSDGAVKIAAREWVLLDGRADLHAPVRSNSRFVIRRYYACGFGQPEPMPDGSNRFRYVIATGIRNARHRLQVRFFDRSGSTGRTLIQAYRPPLTSDT